MSASESRTQVDGRTAATADLAPLAFAGFAHFTAMQVRQGRVRGLDLHLDRLRRASDAFFGQAFDDDHIRALLRAAIGPAPIDLSLVATIFTGSGDYSPPGRERLGAHIRTGPPSDGPAGPLRLDAIPHERAIPHIKQVAEAPKTHYMREAVRRGFDDAAFVDRDGRLSEATIWNLAFWDGEAVVWPEAAILPGTTMGIVQRRLADMGVPQRSQAITPSQAPTFSGAAVMNSWTPGVAVTRIGTAGLPECPSFIDRLHAAYRAEPLVEI